LYKETSNPYVFKYLQTAIRGNGIPYVYLPKVPPHEEILDFGGKWQRQPLPPEWDDWKDVELYENAKIKKHNDIQKKRIEEGLEYQKMLPPYIHPKIEEFVDREWDRRINGVWFYLKINGKKTPVYITGLYYFILQWWNPSFEVHYRDTDREIGYWIEYWEQDPEAMGGILGTMRQYGKSVWLGAWALERTSRTFGGHLGMQGETEKSISEFYRDHVLYGFDRLVDFFTPKYDKDGKQKGGIDFVATKKRNHRLSKDELSDALNARIDYGGANINFYNGRTLTGYVGEESGKVVEVDVYERHKKVKPALRRRNGKAFHASTSDEISEKAKSFYTMVMESDYSDKKANGETKSGLYFAFLPSHHAYSYDQYGMPRSEENLRALQLDREAYSDNPKDYTIHCRQYPITIHEYFYVDANKCQFNVRVLQETLVRIRENPNLVAKVDFIWQDKEDGKVMYVHDTKGRFSVPWLPKDLDREANLVHDHGKDAGEYRFEPLNDVKFCIGVDPIDYGGSGSGGRLSKPVAIVKRKYDKMVDGEINANIKQERMIEKYNYRTGIPICTYDYRPLDPMIFYEHIIKICRFYGCKVHIEATRGQAMIQHFKRRGYGLFVMNRPPITRTSTRYSQNTEGTPASQGLTQTYTAMIAHDVQYFGHCYFSEPLVEDLLKFDPKNTLEHDFAVSWGYTMLAEMDEGESEESVEIDLSFLARQQFPKYETY